MFDRRFMLAVVRGLLLDVRHVAEAGRRGASLEMNQGGGRTSEGMGCSFIGSICLGRRSAVPHRTRSSDSLTSAG